MKPPSIRNGTLQMSRQAPSPFKGTHTFANASSFRDEVPTSLLLMQLIMRFGRIAQ